MKPIKFPGQNIVFAEHQPEYQPLPAFISDDGIVVSCWRLTFRERLRMLFTGRIYLLSMTFNRPLQPLLPSVDNPLKSDPPQPV